MIQSIPIEHKSRQEELCTLCSIPFDRSELAYEITFGDSGERTGILTFKLCGKEAFITNIAETSPSANDDFDNETAITFFIAGRGTLNFLDLHGIHDVYFDNITPKRAGIAKMIGFRENSDGKFYINLRGFFDGSMCETTK